MLLADPNAFNCAALFVDAFCALINPSLASNLVLTDVAGGARPPLVVDFKERQVRAIAQLKIV